MLVRIVLLAQRSRSRPRLPAARARSATVERTGRRRHHRPADRRASSSRRPAPPSSTSAALPVAGARPDQRRRAFRPARSAQGRRLASSAAKNGYANATLQPAAARAAAARAFPSRTASGSRTSRSACGATASISGTVVDEAGEPAVGVRVQAFPRRFVAGRKRFARGGTAVDRRSRRVPDREPRSRATTRSASLHADGRADGSHGRLLRPPARRRRSPPRRARARVERDRLRDRSRRLAVRRSPSGDQTFMLPPGTAGPAPQPDARAGSSTRRSSIPSASAIGEATVVAVRSGDERGSDRPAAAAGANRARVRHRDRPRTARRRTSASRSSPPVPTISYRSTRRRRRR